jgi:hypothetical protein
MVKMGGERSGFLKSNAVAEWLTLLFCIQEILDLGPQTSYLY